ncbi:PqiC family protein [Acetobacter sp. AN02]|uniref:PqiC family protein n=1 Tax=Acetobacter sp. AN02 TaxID=2894186 RepID=UPI0024344A87|nr:PqiC family protein [Acetobacter sp. AN02]MDG6095726.1 PqiC family protein [Acetobacter sp. AN02]
MFPTYTARTSAFRALSAACALTLAASLAACAGPPLKLYTLAPPSPPASGASPETTLQVDHVVLPAYIDNQDILTRNDNDVKRSDDGRWAETLSSGITDLLTADLASRQPKILVTKQITGGAPTARLDVTISRLDITTGGEGTLVAQWAIIPKNENMLVRRMTATITRTADTSSDEAVVAMTQALISDLTDRIVTSLPGAF